MPSVSATTAEALNPLIVETAPSDTLHRCADVFDFLGECGTQADYMTPEAKSGMQMVALVAAAALRFEADRVQYRRKAADQAAVAPAAAH